MEPDVQLEVHNYSSTETPLEGPAATCLSTSTLLSSFFSFFTSSWTYNGLDGYSQIITRTYLKETKGLALTWLSVDFDYGLQLAPLN
jgi:hypothetical protein